MKLRVKKALVDAYKKTPKVEGKWVNMSTFSEQLKRQIPNFQLSQFNVSRFKEFVELYLDVLVLKTTPKDGYRCKLTDGAIDAVNLEASEPVEKPMVVEEKPVENAPTESTPLIDVVAAEVLPPKYLSLFKRYKEQPSSEVFAHFAWKSNDSETWETPYARVAELARNEKWNFTNCASAIEAKGDYPILRSYLNYTFARVLEQGGVIYSADGDRACFNTGLRTRNEKDIFLTFYKNKRREEFDAPVWTFYCVADSYAEQLKGFPELPAPAKYITVQSELVFDTSYDVEMNSEHILEENRHRLPSVLQSNSILARNSIEGAKHFLLENVKRNPMLALPHWYQAESKVQLLLPLYVTQKECPDLALILDKDSEMGMYRVKTAITLDMAYIDARLICPQEHGWLKRV
jgi:hypothetical protein